MGTEVVCTGKPRRRISHEHGEVNGLDPDLEMDNAVLEALKPRQPIDSLIKAWGSI